MERLLTMDKQEYISRMQAECRRIMEQVADAVNNAPTSNVIGGSEMQVRDLLAELRQKAYQTAVQMRIDSHESNFSPSEGCDGEAQGEQRPRQP
jgi:acyl transferase domain-containing protein